jgi:dipeptidyl aminopeptidase/acylaminoacyl peptidase
MQEHNMETLSDTGRRRTSKISFLGQSFLTLAVLGVVAAFIVTQAEPEADPDARDRPFDQASQRSHEGPVWSLAFSPGDSHLAFTTIAGDVWLKDLATDRAALLQRGPYSSARSVAFSPDGRTLAVTGGQPEVRLWNLEAEKELATLEVGGEATTWVAFSPDGTRLAVGQASDANELGTVTIWDWARRQRLATLEGHPGRVTALAFSPDGSRLATASSAGFAALWDANSGRVEARLRVPGPEVGRVVALAFAPDGLLLATAGPFERTLQLWDATSGEPRATISAAPPGVRALAFSPAGTVLALANEDGTTTLWDVATDRELGVVGVEGRSLYSLAFSRDGRQLATGSADGAVRLWGLSEALADKKPAQAPLTEERRGRDL